MNTERALVRRASGSSLIEVLIAMAILAMLMVGVLQLFSLSLVTDFGAAARTEMTMKAQQAAENLRYLHFLASQALPLPPDTGVPAAPTVGTTYFLPWDQATDAVPSGVASWPAWWAYWGPAGANVMEQAKAPYKITYRYDNSATPSFWTLTVTVRPAQAAGVKPALGYLLYNPSADAKKVDYVLQVHQ